MVVNKETIFHYVCDECTNWWSYATSEAYEPKVMYCPHCGIKNKIETKNEEIIRRCQAKVDANPEFAED